MKRQTTIFLGTGGVKNKRNEPETNSQPQKGSDSKLNSMKANEKDRAIAGPALNCPLNPTKPPLRFTVIIRFVLFRGTKSDDSCLVHCKISDKKGEDAKRISSTIGQHSKGSEAVKLSPLRYALQKRDEA